MTSSALARTDESTAVAAPRPTQLLRPIAEPAAVIEAQNATRDMVHRALVNGRDFGVIPGAGDKPTMLKPGAERVALAFGCYYGTPEIIEKEVDHDRVVPWTKTKWVTTTKPKNWEEVKAKGLGRNRKFDGNWVWQERQEESGTSLGLYRYVVRVSVINRATGEVVGSAIGSCSSMESKYIDRPRDCENTVLKMAHKRAMVAACLVTFGLSDEFTQDVEDLRVSNAVEVPMDPSADSADVEAEVVEPEMTLEYAMTMKLPGSATAWNGNGGKVISALDDKFLNGARRWMQGKIDEARASGNAPDASNERLLKAFSLIIDHRKAEAEKNQTNLPLQESASDAGEARSQSQSGTASATPPPSAPSLEMKSESEPPKKKRETKTDAKSEPKDDRSWNTAGGEGSIPV